MARTTSSFRAWLEVKSSTLRPSWVARVWAAAFNRSPPSAAHHPFGIADGSQTTPNQQPVKTRQNSLQVIGEFRDKLVHGVPLMAEGLLVALQGGFHMLFVARISLQHFILGDEPLRTFREKDFVAEFVLVQAHSSSSLRHF
jgi:hypothetical protein